MTGRSIAGRSFFVYILMDFPNDLEISCIASHHFDSTVLRVNIYCAHRCVPPLAALLPLVSF